MSRNMSSCCLIFKHTASLRQRQKVKNTNSHPFNVKLFPYKSSLFRIFSIERWSFSLSHKCYAAYSHDCQLSLQWLWRLLSALICKMKWKASNGRSTRDSFQVTVKLNNTIVFLNGGLSLINFIKNNKRTDCFQAISLSKCKLRSITPYSHPQQR